MSNEAKRNEGFEWLKRGFGAIVDAARSFPPGSEWKRLIIEEGKREMLRGREIVDQTQPKK